MAQDGSGLEFAGFRLNPLSLDDDLKEKMKVKPNFYTVHNRDFNPQQFYLCDSREKSSSDSSSSWLTFTNGIGMLEVSVVAPIPILKAPRAISSC